MTYLIKQSPKHEFCTTPSATTNVQPGDVWRCDECSKIYVFRIKVEPFKTLRWWKQISERKARRLVKRYQRTCRPPCTDLGPG